MTPVLRQLSSGDRPPHYYVCADCGSRNPYLIEDFDGRFVCRHRRACEARQMLADGEPVEKAVAHAQRLRPNQWPKDF